MDIFALLSPATFTALLKFIGITLTILYLIFALVMVRQVMLMTSVVEISIGTAFKVIIWLHFLLSLLLLIVAFTIL